MSDFNLVIAHYIDDDGKEGDITLADIYKHMIEMIKILYFDFMIRCSDADYEAFRPMLVHATQRIMDTLHSTYADHVEGARMAKIDKLKDKKDESNG